MASLLCAIIIDGSPSEARVAWYQKVLMREGVQLDPLDFLGASLGGVLLYTGIIKVANLDVRGIFGEEHWLAMHQINLLSQGELFRGIMLARIPSIFPDYAISFMASIAGHDAESKMLYFIFLSSFAIGVSQILLASRLSRAPIYLSSILYSIIIYLLFNSTHNAPQSLIEWTLTASLPLNHGGIIITTILGASISAKCCCMAGSQKKFGILLASAFAMLAIVSSKLNLITWIFPSILVDLLGSRKISPLRSLWPGLLLVTFVGLGMYRLLPVQPPSELYIRLDVLAANIQRHILVGNETTGIGVLILLSILSLLAIILFSSEGRDCLSVKTSQTLAKIILIGMVLNLAAYPFAATDKWHSPKYALISFVLCPGLLSGFLGFFLVGEHAKKAFSGQNKIRLSSSRSIRFLSVILAATLAIAGNSAVSASRSAYRLLDDYKPAGTDLLALANSHYGLVVINGLNDLGLQAKSDWRYDLFPVSGGGLMPVQWSRSTSELFMDSRRTILKPYSFVLFRKSELSGFSQVVLESLDFSGIQCDSDDTCLINVEPASLGSVLRGQLALIG